MKVAGSIALVTGARPHVCQGAAVHNRWLRPAIAPSVKFPTVTR